MSCCSHNDKIEGVEYDKIKNTLTKISIQIEPIWRGLFICPICNTYWEEHFVDDRFVGQPYLEKVTPQHVINEWGQNYLVRK